MSFYLSINAVQNPFPLGADDDNRALFYCNYNAVGESPIETFELDLAQILNNVHLGTLYVDILIGSVISPPIGQGPFINIIGTGGMSSQATHRNGSKLQYLSAQIIVRGSDYDITQAKAFSIWGALDNRYNITLGGD